MMRFRSVYFLLVICAILAVTLQTNPTQAQTGTSTFGVEIRSFDALPQAEAADTYWLRYNGLLWSDVQPLEGGPYNWPTSLDEKLQASYDAGMEVILIVRGTPNWARLYPNYLCSPMTANYFDEFASFMSAAVTRYSNPPSPYTYTVKYYELWNEPDEYREVIEFPSDPNYNVYGCWGNPSDDYFGGGHYANMLKQAYPAVKAANDEAQVVLGGLLLPCDEDGSTTITFKDSGVTYPYYKQTLFFEGILVNGGKDYFDYVNFHGYTVFDPYDNPVYPGQLPGYKTGIQMERNEFFWKSSGGQVAGKLTYLNGLMTSYGISNKPILMTEAALADRYNKSSDTIINYQNAKADYLVWVFVRNIQLGIKGTTWYHMDNNGWFKSGLLDSANQPLPAYQAYQVMTARLTGATYVDRVTSPDGKYVVFKFTKDGRNIWVLFSVDGSPQTITKPDWFSHVHDLLLRPPLSQTASTITFNRPIYIDDYPNTAPWFTSTPVTSVLEGKNYLYRITTEDGDAFDSRTITATTALPAWLTLVDNGDGTARLYGTPSSNDAGTYTFYLTVKDSGGLTATQKVEITVIFVNDPPRFTSTPVKVAPPGELYKYNITATDPDLTFGDKLTITADKPLPAWLKLVDKGDGTAVLSGTPTADDVKDPVTIDLRVTDKEGLFAIQSFIITSEQVDFPVYIPLFSR